MNTRQFLHQSHDIVGIQCHKDIVTRASSCVADFSLKIPRWAVLKAAQVPDQCLNLPPSTSLGQPYKVPGEQCEYGQPNIEYQLVARITLRRRTHGSGQPPQLETHGASKTVTIMPCSLPSPPTDLDDFPTDFIGSQSNAYSEWFSGTQYMMRLSTAEPSAVILQPLMDSTIMIPVNIVVESGTNKGSASKFMELPSKLKNLNFKVQPILRAKTFYSTVPFSRMPGQTMLTAKGTLRLKDETLRLADYSLRASSWEHTLEKARFASKVSASDALSRASSHGMPIAWTTSLYVPVVVRNNLVPTFCSATAARQYSLIIRIIISGWKIADFILEIPLQIVHSQKNALGKSVVIVDGPSSAFEPISSLVDTLGMVSMLFHSYSPRLCS